MDYIYIAFAFWYLWVRDDLMSLHPRFIESVQYHVSINLYEFLKFGLGPWTIGASGVLIATPTSYMGDGSPWAGWREIWYLRVRDGLILHPCL